MYFSLWGVRILSSAFFLAAIQMTGETCSAQELAPIVLVKNSATDYVIAVSKQASPSETTAAQELQRYIRDISGATLPIVDETDLGLSQRSILVGYGERAQTILPKEKWNELGADGVIIKRSGPNLLLVGGHPRGTLYAVYTFLEDFLGVRWWTEDAARIPKSDTLEIGEIDISYVPSIEYREVFAKSFQEDPHFATRLKINGNHQKQPVEWGGHHQIAGFVHTFERLLPLDRYFKDHPEWYSDPANGGAPCNASSRPPHAWQLCLTSEAARRELTKNAIQWLKDNPDADLISISQNDNQVKYKGPEDMRLEEKEGSPSGPILHFVNAVAEEIEREFPHVMVQTLAYQYTQKPPKQVRPRKNVAIFLCSTEADASRPLNSEANAIFRDDVVEWSKISDHLFIWDYVVNFSNLILPHPNLWVLGPNVKFLADHKTIGLFEQGDAYTGGTGDFTALKTWLLAKMMWNPQGDAKAYVDEFTRGYYGAAAAYLLDYQELIRAAFHRENRPLILDQQDHGYLTLEVLTKADQLFDRAEEAVKNDDAFLQRVKRERLAVQHAWLIRDRALRAEAARRKVPYPGPSDSLAAAEAFVAKLKDLNVPRMGESILAERYAESLIAQFRPQRPLPDSLRKLDPHQIIVADANSFRLFSEGVLASVVADDKIDGAKVVQMRGDSNDWLIQYTLDQDAESLQRALWQCYLLARVEPAEGEGLQSSVPVLQYGFYDRGENKAVFSGEVAWREFKDGKYHLIDMGTHQLKPGGLLWVAPKGESKIKSVYVDRLILVRKS